jgi:hypothetical protein
MATNYTPDRFSVQRPMEILLRNPETLEIIAYLDDLKNSKLDNTGTLVYPTGGVGNVYIGRGFTHSKRAMIEASKATWNTSVLAVQAGTEVIVGSNKNTVKYDVLTVTGDDAVTTFKALGVVGDEIGFAYKVNSDGTLGTKYTQDAVVGAGKFTYTPATKTITFNVGELTDGSKIAVAYKFDSGTSAKTINIDAKSMPSLVLVTADVLVSDICTGLEYPAQINGLAQIDPNWSWDLAADGEPAVENFKMEFVRGCGTSDLYSIIIYNLEDAT